MESIFETIKRRPIRSFMVATFGILLLGSGFVIAIYGVLYLVEYDKIDNFAETTRNFAWLFWMILSLAGAGLGLSLAWWGRDLQQKSDERERLENLEERYVKAANMLSSELEATRIAACLSLADLGKADKSVKSRCVQLLFAFIREPYLETNEVEKYIVLKRAEKEKYLAGLFPADEPLRPDIQKAIDSFSMIYNFYESDGIDNERIELPLYFWRNQRKADFFLTGANLNTAELQEADFRAANLMWTDFSGARLQGANLWVANLSDANLESAILQGANFEEANLQEANLQEAYLREAELPSANLQGANLRLALLVNARLWGADLRNANLCGAYLQSAGFHGVNLQEADMEGAELEGTDITGADMRGVKNLTKAQVLSAKWGHSVIVLDGPPKLPEDLMQDEDIKEWLENPAYDDPKMYRDSG